MQRSFIITLILCFLGGNLGLHRFYTGYIGLGVLYLFTGGLLGIGVLHDLYKLASGDFEDANENYLYGWNPTFAWLALFTLALIYLSVLLHRYTSANNLLDVM